MPDELIIHHCSPTLAGLKTGNIFSVDFDSDENMVDEVRKINSILTAKGLRAIPIRKKDNKYLIYVFRPDHLARDLAVPEAIEILESKGYTVESSSRCIAELARRVGGSNEFPHEIGLFLGYPPVDVAGFMRDSAAAKKSGYWKVYGNVEETEKKFCKFKKCTRVYSEELSKGRPLEKLIVPARTV